MSPDSGHSPTFEPSRVLWQELKRRQEEFAAELRLQQGSLGSKGEGLSKQEQALRVTLAAADADRARLQDTELVPEVCCVQQCSCSGGCTTVGSVKCCLRLLFASFRRLWRDAKSLMPCQPCCSNGRRHCAKERHTHSVRKLPLRAKKRDCSSSSRFAVPSVSA